MALNRQEKWLIGVLAGVFILGSLILLSFFFLFRNLGGLFNSAGYAEAAGSPPAVAWEATFSPFEENRGAYLLEMEDGYLMAGTTVYYNEPDTEGTPYYMQMIHLVRTDSAGGLLWEETYSVDDRNSLLLLAHAEGGGVVIGGMAETTSAEPYEFRLFFMQVDPAGRQEWVQIVDMDYPLWVTAASSTGDGFILAGERWPLHQEVDETGQPFDERPTKPEPSFEQYHPQLLVVKTDPEGRVLWVSTLVDSKLEYISAVQVLPAGGYLLAGSGSYEQGGFITAAIDSEGNLTREKLILEDDYSGIPVAAGTADGGFLFAAARSGFFGGIGLAKTGPSGLLQWELLIGGPTAYAQHLTALADGGALLSGVVVKNRFFSGGQAYVCRVSPEGQLQWEFSPGSPPLLQWDGASCILPLSDGGYLVTGDYGGKQSFLIKLNPDR